MTKFMKVKEILLSALLMAVLFIGVMSDASAIKVDPDKTPEKILTCTSPLQDTQNRPLPVGATMAITLYAADSINGPWRVEATVTPNPNPLCSFTVDTTKMGEGFTYYEVTATVAGIESTRSNRESIEVVITRIPKPPVLLGWQ